ncbi:SDR family NAD(P)-dependent oxidoreductase [Nocardia sp. NPDC052112]|uniref:SDR family NAD(P)-dependent oxidoreductase n=1 Tax=Nocardia sp. NPDC052112 TaxID=3155646 RepID=UPI00343A46B7
MASARIVSDSRVVIVTGASSGIGRSAARRFVELGWRVIGLGRDPDRCAAAETELAGVAAGSSGGFTMLRGDFTLMAEVARLAEEIRVHVPHVDVLINNAGGVRDRRIVTAEGIEATFAANHLAPFLLTRQLRPLLRAAKDTSAGSARVIAVSSSAHRISQGLDWDDLQSLGRFHPAVAYGQAKLANILFTRELARRAPNHIVAQAMHPGIVASNFASHGDGQMRAHMAAANTVSPDIPAETLVWLATDPEGGRCGGRYFHDKAEETPSPAALDDGAAARLWAASEQLLDELGAVESVPTPPTG